MRPQQASAGHVMATKGSNLRRQPCASIAARGLKSSKPQPPNKASQSRRNLLAAIIGGAATAA
eukprot:scaffold362054_cov39-Prasinocladus_malaysianus.AAC.1